MRAEPFRNSRVLAVLGPTNTGKTHFAVERMLGHDSGIIGLPLRLLAREVYDRIVALKGKTRVALITGEEKIVPERPAYFVCTVEAMPLDRPVAFVAVDEIQLAADPDRGHVFTARLLHARGSQETVFLGSDTMRPLLRHLLPDAEVISRPRFSTLRHTGHRKLSRLPARTAVIAYTAENVYAIAELLRRQCGGAAVVMGALSPRTRNAQVALFEAGEVDYLVATDAIGMGLNLNIGHVALASLRKFDGARFRPLAAQELAQVAGRAGRYLNDGTFGTTGDVEEINPEIVEQIEQHRFETLRRLQYRNTALDFGSAAALIRSLEQPSFDEVLVRGREADDLFALKSLTGDERLRAAIASPEMVRLAWDVCRIPDFRKTLIDVHVRLLKRICQHLIEGRRRIPAAWLAQQVDPLDRIEGNIDTLARRLGDIRTWTYVSHQPSWTDDPARWQQRTREIEDRLSDALHQRLTQRFVDKRTSTLSRRLRDTGELAAAVEDDGGVYVEGHRLGQMRGFQFVPESGPTALAQRVVRGASQRALGREIAMRAAAFAAVADDRIVLDDQHHVRWNDAVVGRLVPGRTALEPNLWIAESPLLHGQALEMVRDRLRRWLRAHNREHAGPLLLLRDAGFSGAPGGIAYRLVESLGHVRRSEVTDLFPGLNIAARRALRATGIRFGRYVLYMPRMLKPHRAVWTCRLAAIAGNAPMPATDMIGRASFELIEPSGWNPYEAAGYRRIGQRAIRIDMIERLADAMGGLAERGPFPCNPELLSLVGCRREEFGVIARELGYRASKDAAGDALFHPRRKKRNRQPGLSRDNRDNPHSPFAALGTLRPGSKGS
ncbi:MAG: disulfide oxidoreductase [Alphaproteobacteria bacterium]|nr:disulfide oxidoreductase [Alphaproteobacteria bacterium]